MSESGSDQRGRAWRVRRKTGFPRLPCAVAHAARISGGMDHGLPPQGEERRNRFIPTGGESERSGDSKGNLDSGVFRRRDSESRNRMSSEARGRTARSGTVARWGRRGWEETSRVVADGPTQFGKAVADRRTDASGELGSEACVVLFPCLGPRHLRSLSAANPIGGSSYWSAGVEATTLCVCPVSNGALVTIRSDHEVAPASQVRLASRETQCRARICLHCHHLV